LIIRANSVSWHYIEVIIMDINKSCNISYEIEQHIRATWLNLSFESLCLISSFIILTLMYRKFHVTYFQSVIRLLSMCVEVKLPKNWGYCVIWDSIFGNIHSTLPSGIIKDNIQGANSISENMLNFKSEILFSNLW
jgi:hypothetical protein